MEGYPKFHNEPGVPTVRIGAESSSALGRNRRKTTHTSTLIWAMPVRSSAHIVPRYSVSIRAWVHTKLIRQIVLTVTRIELKGSSAALSRHAVPAANQLRAPSSCNLVTVHDGYERYEFGRMQATRRPS